MSGDFLPPQVIYQGKTSKCLPSVKFPSDWHITFTENHWSNEKAMVDYLEKILFPYIKKKRQELKLDSNYPALVIFDRFRGQCTDNFLPCLKTTMCLLLLFLPTAQTDSSHWMSVSTKQPKNSFAASFKNGTRNKSAISCKRAMRAYHSLSIYE